MISTMRDELIFDLKERFINDINYNQNIPVMKTLINDCNNYLRSYKDNKYEHIQNTFYILKALIDYNIYDSCEKALKKEFRVADLIDRKEEAIEIQVKEYPAIVKHIGLMISKERQLRGVSQEKLAELLGFSIEYISLMERGKRNITLKTIITICKLFDLSIDELVKLEIDNHIY
ncbi:MAG: helix-turn-helix domain-containing protein [Defluviitaleaceae bacterium]|nr:helix-turn-helix domain-containing protein [Defluviitaleaceae bacterium]